ncbi:hypothetical protein PH242_09875 [Photorhabdus bodei]|uniref:hypothetical protein n=1 Tax=Photorhabdus bodei TaxID=2029681 RepID=UPI00232D0932|nr:hypothetical protein [Photorhabdus bodei]MDB6367975.1 hypothetical protein [Photorhabdus bodei]
MTGVSECSQQRGNLKDDGYITSVHFQSVHDECQIQMFLAQLRRLLIRLRIFQVNATSGRL